MAADAEARTGSARCTNSTLAGALHRESREEEQGRTIPMSLPPRTICACRCRPGYGRADGTGTVEDQRWSDQELHDAVHPRRCHCLSSTPPPCLNFSTPYIHAMPCLHDAALQNARSPVGERPGSTVYCSSKAEAPRQQVSASLHTDSNIDATSFHHPV